MIEPRADRVPAEKPRLIGRRRKFVEIAEFARPILDDVEGSPG